MAMIPRHQPLLLSFLFLIIAAAAVIFITSTTAQTPATFCGDGIVQAPNDNGQNEKCDTGGESDSCTASCGAKMLGWAWADTFGWLSLGCGNDQSCSTVNYYVQVAADDTVQGWAWSPNVGWLCFGTTCIGPPPSGNLSISLVFSEPEEPPSVTGWAQATALGDSGWFSLSCENDNSCSNIEYTASIIAKDYCSFFEGDQTACEANATLHGCSYDAGAQSCLSGAERLTLAGFGWNPLLGWLWATPEISQIPPWLQTRFGDIYSRGGFTVDKPQPGFNATYRILAGGSISPFAQSARGQTFLDEQFGPIDFPTPQTRFSNVLGRLDVDGLLCAGSPCKNQFGQTVVTLPDVTLDSVDIPGVLGGQIYHSAGDLTIDQALTFGNGSNFENAAGTFIIDGNLTINADVFYDVLPSSPTFRFRNLASVVWIVRGDLQVAPSVGQLAGNFIVIGNGTLAVPNDCQASSEIPRCGQVYSCFNSASCNKRLTVSGLLMARKFYFDRTFTDKFEAEIKGSEIILYDGRLLANTPPGVENFAQALPIWRPGTFSP